MAQESERLRHKTDTGRLSDKVDFADPATAPIGTDDEAAGRPPDANAVARSMARQEEIAAAIRSSPTDSLAPEGAPAVSYDASKRPRTTRTWLIPAIVGIAVAALVAWVIWLTFPT